MKILKKTFLFFLIFFISLFSVLAADSLSFTDASSSTVLTSSTDEKNKIFLAPKIVFENGRFSDYLYGSDGRLHSRLDWTPSCMFKAGVSLDSTFGNFVISTSSVLDLPFKAGHLYDSDWQNESAPDMKTSFSEHELKSSFGFDFLFSIKYKVPIFEKITLIPSVSFEHRYSEFEAAIGKAWKGSPSWTELDEYCSWDSPYAAKKKVYGIDFYTGITNLFFGTEFLFNLGRAFISPSVEISPWCKVLSLDHHLNKERGRFYQMDQTAFFSVYKLSLFSGYEFKNDDVIKFGVVLAFSNLMKGEYSGELYSDDCYSYFPTGEIEGFESSSFKFSVFNFELSYSLKLR